MGLDFGYVDGQTPLDADEKEGLRIKSISTQGELDEFEQMNIQRAVEWTIHNNFQPERILTEKFVKTVHEKMFGEVWKWAGKFRKTDKNLGIQWYKIPVELAKLLEDTRFWITNESFAPEEICIRFKHRIVAIHCFPNGNGRHSRLMADILMENIFDLSPFTWHRSNMIKPDATRKKYIAALKKADQGNISDLIDFAKN